MSDMFERAPVLFFPRRLTKRTAMSLAAFAGVATALVVPMLAREAAPSLVAIAPANLDRDSVWLAPTEADGKIGARHRAAMDREESADRSGLLMPAALVMPMSTGWPEQNFSEAARLAQLVPHPTSRGGVSEAPASLRKVLVSNERARPPARPLAITAGAAVSSAQPAAQSVVEVVEVRTAPQPTVLDRVVYEPVAQAGNLVSGAAGLVGAAGSWTVSQASSLLPRW